jgi:RNA polymerase-binding protein DksA
MTGVFMDADSFTTIRATLVRQKTAVEQRLTEHGAAPTDDDVSLSVNEGFADSAQATAERSQLISMIEGLRSHYLEIVGALRRLDDGTYGKCDRCGREIPIERLEARPTSALCVGCKQATAVR